MTREKRIPYFRFYTTDWRGDVSLRMCSYAARGLWIDLLTLMHESTSPGLLLVSGKVPTTRQIASLLGGSEKEIAKLLEELERAEIFSRNADGAIFSRRMVRDKAKEEMNRLNGKEGGNPSLKPKPAPADNEGVNPQPKAHGITTSSKKEDLPSTSVPTSAKTSATPEGGGADEAVAIISEFDASRSAAYGVEQARPWPAPNDLVVAQRLVGQGATAALCRHVFDSRNAKLKAEGHKPRATLKAFEPDVVQALEDKAKPADGAAAAPLALDLDGRFVQEVILKLVQKRSGSDGLALGKAYAADPAAGLAEARRWDAELRRQA